VSSLEHMFLLITYLWVLWNMFLLITYLWVPWNMCNTESDWLSKDWLSVCPICITVVSTHRYVINKKMCSKELTDMLMFHRTYRYIITCPTGILLIRNIWLDHLTNKNLMSFFVDQLSITFQDFIFFFRNIYSANQN
jgi:hypothetical protein